jgi:hypothetical protein
MARVLPWVSNDEATLPFWDAKVFYTGGYTVQIRETAAKFLIRKQNKYRLKMLGQTSGMFLLRVLAYRFLNMFSIVSIASSLGNVPLINVNTMMY